MFKASKYFLAPLLLLTAACTANNWPVPDHPPVIANPLTFDTQYGTLTPEEFSMFLWPTGLNDQQMSDLIFRVNSDSQKVDDLYTQRYNLNQQSVALYNTFIANKCIETWDADYVVGSDPTQVGDVINWKAPNVNDTAGSQALQNCKANQNTRDGLSSQMDDIGSNQLPPVVQEIYQLVDPQNPTEWMSPVDAADSKVTIEPGAHGAKPVVTVLLKDFINAGNTQSTDVAGPGQIRNASYDLDLHLLQFDVPELNANKAPTGNTYHFALERTTSFLGMARFIGHMDLISRSGAVLRNGSAKIDGMLQ